MTTAVHVLSPYSAYFFLLEEQVGNTPWIPTTRGYACNSDAAALLGAL